MALVQLPSVLVASVEEVVATGLHVINAIPDNGETGVALNQPIAFEIYNADGAAPVAGNIDVEVGGVVVFSGGGPMAGWGAVLTSPDASTRRFLLTPPAAHTSDVAIEVVVTIGGGTPAVHTYSFETIDVIAPRTLSAVARSKKVLRVTFSEGMRQLDPTATGDALNPAHYLIDRVTRPAVALEVVSVEPISATEVDLHLDIEMTFGAGYQLTVSEVLDDAGNAHVVAPDNFVEFTGFVPPFPEGRRFLLTDFIPAMNLAEDGTGDLAMFLACVQEVTNVLLCDIDEWGRILDPDTAPEAFVDAMLDDLGNPFTFELSEVDKRRLLRELVRIYQLKGTAPGIMAAVLFFTGLVVSVRTYTGTGFVIGTNTLSTFGTPSSAHGTLGPGQSGLYSFKVVSAVDLTEEQRQRIAILAEYMRGAHEHYLGTVEPTSPSAPPTHVVLGWSRLGGTGSPGTWVLG